MTLIIKADRHPATRHFADLFEYGHLPHGDLRDTSAQCQGLAQAMVDRLNDGPELTAGLRKLVEAKDCFVRQSVADGRAKPSADREAHIREGSL